MPPRRRRTSRLPRDVLCDILLRLPAFHLRGLRHVCKEWREVISSFVDAHRPRAPTHTVVFSPGRPSSWWPFQERLGYGWLFDEQWRFTARFTVDISAELLGTCNSLLFFLLDDVIKVVEPFTGESIAVPPSPHRCMYTSASSYGLGFDPVTRQLYKIIVHGLCNYPSRGKIIPAEQNLYVFTVGADEEWRTVRIACALHGVSYKEPTSGDGAVYWRGETPDGIRYVRFDLTTEEITSVDRRVVDGRGMPVGEIACKYPGTSWGLCDIRIRWLGEWDDACWPHNITALPHEVRAERLRRRRLLPEAHALQRGHLLLQEEDQSLYTREIESSSACMTELYLVGSAKLLMETGQMEEEEEPTERYKFVPPHYRQKNKSVTTRSTVAKFSYEQSEFISTFAYTPTLYRSGLCALAPRS